MGSMDMLLQLKGRFEEKICEPYIYSSVLNIHGSDTTYTTNKEYVYNDICLTA